MPRRLRLLAFLEALLAVLLWSASPPLVKLALVELSPLQIAALRYTAASLFLMPLLFTRARPDLRSLSRRDWLLLALMGIITYAVGNGLFFWGMKTLPATTASFLFNCIPVFTLFLGMAFLHERPRRIQWLGVVVALAGALLFLGWPLKGGNNLWAIGATLLAGMAFSVSGVLARSFRLGGRISSLVLTVVPQFVGGMLLLLIAPPQAVPTGPTLSILAWLAVVNSALGYMLWYHAFRRLQAFETGFLGNLMPMGTALLAPIIIGERVEARAWLGIVVALIGTLLVGLGGGLEASVAGAGRR
jgi:O-acetylserine/cysteine efflux transporter